MNRKYFKILLSVLMLFALLFVACGEKEKSIKITGNKDLEVGETLQLTATVENGATEDKVKWSSSNENLAKIEEGLLTALAAGNVTIKAELTTDAKVYAEVSVTIKEKEVVLNPEITSLEGENKLFVGEETTLVAQTKDLGDKTLVWTSSDDTVATVENGLVKALKEGKVTITCKVEGLDDTAKTLEIEIVDLSKVVIELNVTEGNIDELYANDVLKLSYTLSIEGLEVVWSSSDDSIAKVEDGVVTCLKVGNVTITVSLVENPEVKTSINVNVKSETSSVDVLKEQLTSLLNSYLQSNEATLKIDYVNGENKLVNDYGFKLNAEGTFEKLYNANVSTVTSLIAIKEGYVYNKVNETENKMEVSSEDLEEIFDAQCIEAVLGKVTKFYTEEAFYDALSYDKTEGNIVTYKLNIRNYKGTVLETINFDEISLNVEFEDSVIKSVEYVAVSQGVVKSIKVAYLGLAFNIVFPDDLENYPEF